MWILPRRWEVPRPPPRFFLKLPYFDWWAEMNNVDIQGSQYRVILALEAYLCCTYIQPCSFPLPSQAFLLCIPEKLSVLYDSQLNIDGVNKNNILAISLLSWRDTCSSSVLRVTFEVYHAIYGKISFKTTAVRSVCKTVWQKNLDKGSETFLLHCFHQCFHFTCPRDEQSPAQPVQETWPGSRCVCVSLHLNCLQP